MGGVLVVEDDPDVSELLGAVLTPIGLEVRFAFGVKEAIAAAERETPDFVTLDYGLPDGTGVDVCRALRTFYRGPILMMTAHPASDVVALAVAAGVDEVQSKPFHPRRLRADVARLMASRS